MVYRILSRTILFFLLFQLGAIDSHAGIFSSCASAFLSLGKHPPSGPSFASNQVLPLREEYYRLITSGSSPQEVRLAQKRLFAHWTNEAALGRAYKPVLARDKFVGEHLVPGMVNAHDKRLVEYLSPEQLKTFEVQVGADGLIRDASGELLGQCADGKVSAECGKFIFVMDPEGRIFIHTEGEPGPMRFKHSSFLSGAPVASSGKTEIINGKLLYIDSNSGHYRPDREHFSQVIKELMNRKANMKDIKITVNHP